MAATRYLFLCILIILVTGQSAGQWNFDDNSCTTPDGANGVCMSIKSCKPIVDFLTAKPLTPADRRLLSRYQCGYDTRSVKVCCPDKPITTQGGGGSVDSVNDIMLHPNINLLPVENCGMIQSDDKILNGNLTALFEFPWMALLRYNQDGEDIGFRCGGTLINNRYILTAAHCISNLKPGRVLAAVRLGEYDIKLDNDCETHFEGDVVCADPVQDFTIAEMIPHPRYNITSFENDIALIRLSRNANVSVDSVKPVCLPIIKAVRNPFLKKGIVTGWGRTTNSLQSNVLLKVELDIMSLEECKNRYKTTAKISEKQICAGGINEKDSCSGDSGGPLQIITQYQTDVRYVQYGVVSFGPNPCSTRGLPGVYTKISDYLRWILDTVKA